MLKEGQTMNTTSSKPAMGRRLSSRMTFFHKRIFPTIWFGILGTFLFESFFAPKTEGPWFIILIAPVVMAVFGYFIMKALVWDLVDEVYDHGDYLLVRNKAREQRIHLGDIINVSYSVISNPHRVTLTVRSKTGDSPSDITFAPPTDWVPLRKQPIIQKLIERIDAARSQ
jgi:hypothetical protein